VNQRAGERPRSKKQAINTEEEHDRRRHAGVVMSGGRKEEII